MMEEASQIHQYTNIACSVNVDWPLTMIVYIKVKPYLQAMSYSIDWQVCF